MTDILDRAEAPRASETLNLQALQEWLALHLPEMSGEALQLLQFRKGHSNLTYLLVNGERRLVLRRAPFGVVAGSAHDMSREYRILSGLHRAYAPAPRAVAFCDSADVIGAPFYVMESISGVILRRTAPSGYDVTGENGVRLWDAFVHNLAAIHSVSLESAGLEGFGKPEGYIYRQVSGWTERYRRSQTDEIPAMEEAAAWLAAHIPAENRPSLLHNDYKLDNLVLHPDDPGKVIGVLDWEMAAVGDPLMDLGTSLGYHINFDDPDDMKALPLNLPPAEDTPSRQQLVDRYAALTGRETSSMLFFYIFGLFKIAVVAQQIYWRFKAGKTDDPRFGMMIFGVHALSNQASRAIATGRI
jgi:aminoglycoside phosphotransferase (APT) family kinase protein